MGKGRRQGQRGGAIIKKNGREMREWIGHDKCRGSSERRENVKNEKGKERGEWRDKNEKGDGRERGKQGRS